MAINTVLARILGAERGPLSGHFSTMFADGSLGEAGSFLFESKMQWVVSIDGAGIQVNSEQRGGWLDGDKFEVFDAKRRLHRPPWSLCVPTWALIFGREGDDYSIGRELLSPYDGQYKFELLHPSFTAAAGSVLIDAAAGAIVQLRTPNWVAGLDLHVEVDKSLINAKELLRFSHRTGS